jgi:hypothetical protein
MKIFLLSYLILLVAELQEVINWFRLKFLPAAVWSQALKLAQVLPYIH